MAQVTMCPTKAGKGYKVVVNGEWLYTSKRELEKMLSHQASAAKFRSVDEWKRHVR